MNDLEKYISELNSNVFFREFSYARNKFSPEPKNELEFSDNVVWIDDLMITFQMKERNISGDTNADKEEKWFNDKVIGTATKQIRNTLGYLKDYDEIHLTNGRNHVFNVATANLKSVDSIVLYAPHDNLPNKCRYKKYHRSKSAGFIHLFSIEDYIGICETLVTLLEIHHYLSYREELINRWDEESANIPEAALVGHFLYGDLNKKPSDESIKYLTALKSDRLEWDYTNVARIFADRMTVADDSKDYYKIITELARFKRSDLKMFKQRYDLSIEKALANESVKPYRFVIPRRCGFLFIPITKDIKHRTRYLSNLTLANKYDQKIDKCIGLSITPDRDGYFYVEWCYIEFPWSFDKEMEIILKDSFPFRPVTENYVPTYTFDNTPGDNKKL